jgi:putative phosphoesterase
VVVVADTHARPHPKLGERIRELRPSRILHAGDVGSPAVLEELATYAPVTAVRGNVDERGLPDVVTIDCQSDAGAFRILLTHIAVSGIRLRADALRLARDDGADLVVCGHSHVPLVARDHGIAVFNPGSAGPRRFDLPIVFGAIELGSSGLAFRHVDCETGQDWRP